MRSVWTFVRTTHRRHPQGERNIEIVGADLATRHGFTQVPNFILTKKDISVGAKLAYAMLLKYAWGNDACFPGQVKLAEDMGVRRAQRPHAISRNSKKLACWRSVQRGLGKTNLYRLISDGAETQQQRRRP